MKMNFLEAVKQMKEGKKVTRPNWSGYIYMRNRRVYHKDGEFKNTPINQFEATDWEIYDYNFDTLFQKITPYVRREGLTNLADAMGKKDFWTRLIETQIDNSYIEELEVELKKQEKQKKHKEVTDEEIAELESELKKLEEKDFNYGSVNKAKIEIIRLNKLFISLNKAWARKDMKGIKAYLAMIEREVRWK